MLFSRSFIALSFTIMSVIHFQLILVMGVRTMSKLISFACPVGPAPFPEKTVFSPFVLSLFLFAKIYWLYLLGCMGFLFSWIACFVCFFTKQSWSLGFIIPEVKWCHSYNWALLYYCAGYFGFIASAYKFSFKKSFLNQISRMTPWFILLQITPYWL